MHIKDFFECIYGLSLPKEGLLRARVCVCMHYTLICGCSAVSRVYRALLSVHRGACSVSTLCTLKTALYTLKKDLYTLMRALSTLKRNRGVCGVSRYRGVCEV